ncbi:hypothetical protein EON67_02210 [archaeon]|nr:MAG: hypothetical protein EON67_02210 [archaeon]
MSDAAQCTPPSVCLQDLGRARTAMCPSLCCRRPTDRMLVAKTELETLLLRTQTAERRAVASLQRAQYWSAVAGTFMLAVPTVVVLVMAMLAARGHQHRVHDHWLAILIALLLPPMLCYAGQRWMDFVVSRRGAATAALQKQREELLQRVRHELSMEAALALLQAYDPHGDHKVRWAHL